MTQQTTPAWRAGKKNFVLIGESGCGKSEIAVNLALMLAKENKKPVHFFDLDQTKPLFRARDLQKQLQAGGVFVHWQEQYLDAPALVSGVPAKLMDPDVYTVLDVGGSENGAKMIGGFAHLLGQAQSSVLYVVNHYRAFGGALEAVDQTLGAVLQVSRLRDFYLVANPNLGTETGKAAFLEGYRATRQILSPYRVVDLVCVSEMLYPCVKGNVSEDLMPLHLFFEYPWQI